MILGIIMASLITTALFRMVQNYYFPLHSKSGMQPFLFAIISVAIGFLIGWAEGVVFFIVYFFSGIVINGLTKEQEPDDKTPLEKQIEAHLKEIKDNETFLDRWTANDREGLVHLDGNSANIFYCPKCGEQQDTEDQFSERHVC